MKYMPREALLSLLGDFHFDHYSTQLQAFLLRALHFIVRYHEKRLRKSGQRYIEHDCRTARRALAMGMPLWFVIVMLLHEAIEDDGKTKEWLRKNFDILIAETVVAVSKLAKNLFTDRSLRLLRHIETMVYAIVDGKWWVAIAKLLDRHDNTIDTAGLSDEDRQRLFEETQAEFLPFFHWAEQFIPKRFLRIYRMLVMDIEEACDNYWRSQALSN